MVPLGHEAGSAGWKVQTNPLSYGGNFKNFLYQEQCDQIIIAKCV